MRDDCGKRYYSGTRDTRCNILQLDGSIRSRVVRVARSSDETVGEGEDSQSRDELSWTKVKGGKKSYFRRVDTCI